MVGRSLSLKSKIGLGVLLSYGSYETFLLLRSKYTIYQREQEHASSNSTDGDTTRFRSAMVAGYFINPFKEYRPQTVFEYVYVRILEAAESFYGSTFEIHNKLTDKEGQKVELETLLKPWKPDLETLRTNSLTFSSCALENNFQALTKGSGLNLFNSNVPLRDQLIFTWFGQSCSLVQISGINFFTDPLLEDHLISKTLGPKRLVKAPVNLENIKYACNGNINFTLVSHDHPDHLDLTLAKEIGNSTTWIVPLGLKSTLGRLGIWRVVEMDWWETLPLNKLFDGELLNLTDDYEIACLPAMHWSGRKVIDSNRSLWCSFMLKRNGESIVYHAGDTGYLKDLFDAIGKSQKPVFLSLLPIGQYCPSWHQSPRHISPEEALEICKHLSSQHMKGVHWGTFKLSSEPILEPRNKLTELAQLLDKKEVYNTPEMGLSYLFNLNGGKQTVLDQGHLDIDEE